GPGPERRLPHGSPPQRSPAGCFGVARPFGLGINANSEREEPSRRSLSFSQSSATRFLPWKPGLSIKKPGFQGRNRVELNSLVAAAPRIAAAAVVIEERLQAERVALPGRARLAARRCGTRLARHFLFDRPANHAGCRHGFFDRNALGHRPL